MVPCEIMAPFPRRQWTVVMFDFYSPSVTVFHGEPSPVSTCDEVGVLHIFHSVPEERC